MHRQDTALAPSAQETMPRIAESPKVPAHLAAMFDDAVALSAAPLVNFTTIVSDRPLSKRFGIVDGVPQKVAGDVPLVSGRAERTTLSGVPTEMAEQLAARLNALGSNNALICAPPPAGPDTWPITTEKAAAGRPDVISRTKECFRPVAGQALMGLDFDTKDYPAHIRDRLLAIPHPNLTTALSEAFPALSAAASVQRSSMSAGIRIKGTKVETSRNGGLHRYFFVENGLDVQGFVERFSQHLMLRGWLWAFVSAAGTVTFRTLFDVTASADTSRLFYEGKPVLEDERLEFVADRRHATPSPGGMLDTSLLAPLTASESRRLEELKAEAREARRDEIDAARAAFLETRGRGTPGRIGPVKRATLVAAVENYALMGDFPIQLDDGGTIAVRDILARPMFFNKQTCADPLEPEYGGGRNKAIIYSDGRDPRIVSQAHGGVHYTVQTDPADWFEDLGPKPRDVFGDGDSAAVLDIPAGALPPVIDDWARDVSERIGAPQAFAAVAALATISGAIGSKLRIQPKEFDTGWLEPAFLWFGIVEAPGGRKSPIIAQATAPLSRIDAQKARAGAEAWGQWAERKRAAKRGQPFAEPEPKISRHMVDNFTVEALSGVLADNPNGVLVSVDELTGLIGSLDAYKANRGGDRPMMLRLFDGRENRVDRVGRKHTFIGCWGASIIGGIQPRKITELASDLDADGLLQRFLPVWGDGERRNGVDRSPDRAAMEGYEAAVRQIAEASFVFPGPITLSPQAQALWRPLTDRIAALAGLPGLSDAWSGHMGKWPGFSARLLLVCHVLDHLGDRMVDVDRVPVTAATAERALKLVDWLLGNSLRFYTECIGAGQAGDDAKWIAGYLLSAKVEGTVTRRDLGQAKRDFRDDPYRVVQAMRFLEHADWCDAQEQHADRHGPTRWTICPAVHDGRFASRADAERQRRQRERKKIEAAASERRRLMEVSRDGN